jgi:hypothetical protein
VVRDLPVARPVPDPLAEVWAGLYDCPLSAACHDVHFDPAAGLVPRGIWSLPSLDRVELLVVAHNPGTPRRTRALPTHAARAAEDGAGQRLHQRLVCA